MFKLSFPTRTNLPSEILFHFYFSFPPRRQGKMLVCSDVRHSRGPHKSTRDRCKGRWMFFPTGINALILGDFMSHPFTIDGVRVTKFQTYNVTDVVTNTKVIL